MKTILIILSIHFTFNHIFALVCNGPHEYRYEHTPVCPLECQTLHIVRCMSYLNIPSCQCKDGTIRDRVSHKCVPLTECPKYYENPLKCNETNEEYADSVSACPATCAHPVGPLCHAIIHKPSCVCANRTVRDTNTMKCVDRDQCPKNT